MRLGKAVLRIVARKKMKVIKSMLRILLEIFEIVTIKLKNILVRMFDLDMEMKTITLMIV